MTESAATKRLAERTELRRRAVARLRNQPLPAVKDAHLPAGAARLVHELQVHQIELEIQNEELQRTHAELEAALRRYTNLYEFAPVGYLTLERSGEIVMLNLAAALLLGVERSRLRGSRFGAFVASDERPALNELLERVFTSRTPQSGECTLDKAGKSPLKVQIEARGFGDGSSCVVVLIDITQRRSATK